MILLGLALPFALLGAFCLLQVFASLGPFARLVRRSTTPVRELAEGPVEVAGTLRARAAALEAIDGTQALALRTIVSGTAGSDGNATSLGRMIDEVVAVTAELDDGTGICELDTTAVLLLGEERSASLDAATFAERYPALWKRIASTRISRVTVEQSIVRDGARGLASGRAEAMEPSELDPGDGYRGGGRETRRFRLAATAEQPLILSAFDEPRTRRRLLRPAWTFAVLASLWFAVAGALVVASRAIGD